MKKPTKLPGFYCRAISFRMNKWLSSVLLVALISYAFADYANKGTWRVNDVDYDLDSPRANSFTNWYRIHGIPVRRELEGTLSRVTH